SGSTSAARTTSCGSWPTHSMRCWPAWMPRSKASGSSWPTPAPSCGTPPPAVIRTEPDVTLSDPDAPNDELRRMGEVVLAAAERAQRLLSSLLTLARLQAGVSNALEVQEPVDLAELIPGVLKAV